MNKPLNQSRYGDKYKSGHDAIFKAKPELMVCFGEVEFKGFVMQTFRSLAKADEVIPSLLKWKTFVGTHGAKIDGMNSSSHATAKVGAVTFSWYTMSTTDYESRVKCKGDDYFAYSHSILKPITDSERKS